MKKLSLLLTVLFTTIIWAQAPEKMSYQAVIRDASNALITNQNVGMQISILQGSTTGTAIYEETQTPTSNTNGLISLEIGTGTVISGDFTNIDWSNDTYFIKTETDPTGGTNYSITGTSQLLSVPYALHAKTAENVSGLEKITESGKTGWRMIGQDSNNYGDTGLEAVNLSYSAFSSTTRGSTGNNSIAMGKSTTASGRYATTMGSFTTASEDNSTAMGVSTTASGDSSTAMGAYTTASGRHSTAMGNRTTAETYFQTTIGQFNTPVTGSLSTFVSTDRLFVIGNGSNASATSDALTILKNGTITAPSLDITEITDNKSLITKEYLEANGNTPATGLEQITENGNTGWRLTGANPANYGDIGDKAIDLSYSYNAVVPFGAMGNSSIAVGTRAITEGDNSIAMGLGAHAVGINSVAMGNNTKADGNNSIAMGNGADAGGDNSVALNGRARGNYSATMGKNNTAESYAETVLGINSTAVTGNPTTFIATDRLFVIGNGVANNTKSDALVMLKNGNTTINGDLKVNEVNATDSGNADMKAYAYGLVGPDASGSVVNTDGYTLTYQGIGSYRITFNVPMARTKYIAVATLHDGIGFINLIRQNNYIEVRTYNTSGTPSDRGFYFVVYKK